MLLFTDLDYASTMLFGREIPGHVEGFLHTAIQINEYHYGKITINTVSSLLTKSSSSLTSKQSQFTEMQITAEDNISLSKKIKY